MKGQLLIAVCLGCIASTIGVRAQDARPARHAARPFRGFLCDTALHAISFADVVAKGQGEEVARDRVGRQAEADACGRYVGIAAIESESIMLRDGVAYKLTAYRFREDQRVAWLAETTFAPVASSWPL